jgi:hypothetical protein
MTSSRGGARTPAGGTSAAAGGRGDLGDPADHWVVTAEVGEEAT